MQGGWLGVRAVPTMLSPRQLIYPVLLHLTQRTMPPIFQSFRISRSQDTFYYRRGAMALIHAFYSLSTYQEPR